MRTFTLSLMLPITAGLVNPASAASPIEVSCKDGQDIQFHIIKTAAPSPGRGILNIGYQTPYEFECHHVQVIKNGWICNEIGQDRPLLHVTVGTNAETRAFEAVVSKDGPQGHEPSIVTTLSCVL